MGMCDDEGCRQVHVVHPHQSGKTMLAEVMQTVLDDDKLATLGRRTATLSSWLDQELTKTKVSPELLTRIRVDKIAEETGEVFDALTGITGTNPRKGVVGSWDDVRTELLDVALTALGAYEHLTGTQGSSGYALLYHVRMRLERLGLKVE